MRRNISYPAKMREQAKAENKVLYTVEIDRRHCINLPDEERGSMTMQGPGSGAADEAVTRLLLELSGVRKEEIDKCFVGRFPRKGVAQRSSNRKGSEGMGLFGKFETG